MIEFRKAMKSMESIQLGKNMLHSQIGSLGIGLTSLLILFVFSGYAEDCPYPFPTHLSSSLGEDRQVRITGV